VLSGGSLPPNLSTTMVERFGASEPGQRAGLPGRAFEPHTSWLPAQGALDRSRFARRAPPHRPQVRPRSRKANERPRRCPSQQGALAKRAHRRWRQRSAAFGSDGSRTQKCRSAGRRQDASGDAAIGCPREYGHSRAAMSVCAGDFRWGASALVRFSVRRG